MTEYIVMNNNPIVGRVKENGKQEIKVYDQKTGNMRYLEANKDKVDVFINNRSEVLKKQNKISTIIGTVVTAGLGTIGAFAGKKLFDGLKYPGAVLGAGIGLVASLIGHTIMSDKKDECVTQKFIDENK